MKLLLDQGLPRSTAVLLKKAGIDAFHTGDIGMATAGDTDILARGKKEGYTIVTLDADFHALLAVSGDTTPSVIRIRIEGLNGQETSRLLLKLLEDYHDDLKKGVLLTVQSDKIRFRFLPIH